MQFVEDAVQTKFPRIRVSYEPAPGEEWPMTFQVGMLCHPEGAILASDRKMTRRTGLRTGYQSPKIECYPDENIAFCSAGDDLCVTFAKILRERMRSWGFAGKPLGLLRQEMMDCVNSAWCIEKQHKAVIKEETGRDVIPFFGGTTLVVLREPGASVQLWSINTNRDLSLPNPQPVDGFLPIGDNSAAIFFLNRYWKGIKKTINDLLPLAVHTILMAESEFVEGLEIGVFTQSRFEVLQEDALQEEIDKSKQIDSYIAQMLGVTNPKISS